ncbi:class I adenylate-forming enzyme family protein [Micromonospora eburnea]|uniref:Acyl-CoA synthetase (AMP-forming)/AMP-acid ligase II n=1 Tax=Micromonospora eburnea TaxID=227316 RepID=A0A1C6V0M3_9ACTN|nr:class I adenylate-forming enzyme family protein [Micromonospora eburnea]SCL59654.1 Acyl-CoA synthetase (AMP-forming)/AMP-acid ligase II [Micromonospora eburnea]
MSTSDPQAHLRARLAADSELGAGNVLVKLREHGADPDGPGITFDVPVDGRPAWTALTLGELTERVAARAAWLHERGIGPRDVVAVYAASAADVLLNFAALTWLGAIPALMNLNMPGEVAVQFIQRLRATAVLADAERLPLLAGRDLGGATLLPEIGQTGTGEAAKAPAHYRHHGSDPIAITHSSGTTRVPAAVVHSHDSLFAAIRRVRLTEARPYGQTRELSLLPAAHTAGIITLNQALCNRYELAFLSNQGGPIGRSGEAVLDAIERWRPTGVFGFAVTWAELARHDLATRDLRSVRNWFNTGDCAHEAHIRRLVAVGSHPERRDGVVVEVPGSKFIDGIGSTEMGHSAFQITHRLGSDRYGRCVGKPYPFADVALLDLETGEPVPDGTVGHVALKSPTLALGYWNDSVTTFRTRFAGYYLTGDLMYKDAEGYYYHVDRAVDAVDLGGGDRLYTALSEERILARCPDVRDCTVVAGPQDGRVVTDVLLMLEAGADPGADRGPAIREALGAPAAATLRHITVADERDIVFGPTGKVRKFLMRQRHLAKAGA